LASLPQAYSIEPFPPRSVLKTMIDRVYSRG
jgi:hypothetical protein